jgi:hypothetical protein
MAAMPGHLKRSKALLAATPFLLAAFLVEMCSSGGGATSRPWCRRDCGRGVQCGLLQSGGRAHLVAVRVLNFYAPEGRFLNMPKLRSLNRYLFKI